MLQLPAVLKPASPFFVLGLVVWIYYHSSILLPYSNQYLSSNTIFYCMVLFLYHGINFLFLILLSDAYFSMHQIHYRVTITIYISSKILYFITAFCSSYPLQYDSYFRTCLSSKRKYYEFKKVFLGIKNDINADWQRKKEFDMKWTYSVTYTKE